MIPQNVLDALIAVLAGGMNVMHPTTVAKMMDAIDEDAADWLRNHPTSYMEAVNQARAMDNGGDEE